MSEADPGVDISYTRPIVGVSSTVPGFNTVTNAIVQQAVVVSPTFPGKYVVTVTGGASPVNQVHLPPMRGLQVAIDALASVNDITIAPGAPGAIPPNTRTVTVPAGTYSIVEADGAGWNASSNVVPAGVTFTSAAVVGVVDANVANLAVFAVAAHDTITFVQNDLILLMKQTAPEQNGPYVVGAVVAGNAILTRPTWWTTGSLIPMSFDFKVSGAGAVYKNLTARTYCVAGQIVDTNAPLLFFTSVGGEVNGGAGTYLFERGLGGTGSSLTHPAAGRFVITALVGVSFTQSAIKVSPAAGGAHNNITFDVIQTSATQIEVQVYQATVLTDLFFTVEMSPYGT